MYVSKRSHLEHHTNARGRQQNICVLISIKNYDTSSKNIYQYNILRKKGNQLISIKIGDKKN